MEYLDRYRDLIILADNRFNIIYCNKSLRDFLNADRSVSKTESVWDIIFTKNKVPENIESINASLNSYQFYFKSGKPVEIDIYPSRGTEKYFEIILRNSTVGISQVELLDSLFERSKDGYFFMMLDEPIDWDNSSKAEKNKLIEYALDHHRITRVNKSFAKQYDSKMSDMIGLSVRDFFAHDIEYGKKVWWEFFENKIWETNTKERTNKGREVTISGTYLCLTNEKGEIIGHFGVQKDITRQEANEALMRKLLEETSTEKALFGAILNSVPDLIFYKDSESKYLGANESYANYLKTNSKDLIGKTDLDFLQKAKAYGYLTSDKKVMKTGSTVRSEDIVQLPGQPKKMFETIKNPIRDADNNIIGLIGISRDITQRDRINSALTSITKVQEIIISSNDVHQAIERSFKIILDYYDLDEIFLYKNDQKRNLKTVSRLHAVYRDGFEENIEKNSRQNVEFKQFGFDRWINLLKQNRIVKGNTSSFPKKERDFYETINVKSTIVAPIFVQGNFYGFLGFNDNQKERNWDGFDEFIIRSLSVTIGNSLERYDHLHLLESKNKELKKINKELDSFVYSTSHDLRAPIASLLGLIEIMELEHTTNDRFKEYLTIQKAQINKLDHFIRDILDYSRNTRIKPEFKETKIRLLLSEILENFSHYQNSVNTKVHLSVKDDCLLFSDELRLKVILGNIISNAFKFTSNLNEPKIEINVVVSDSQLELEVIDNGPGIDQETQSKIFNMFFRASEERSGTGLGLYIAKEAALKLKGRISVENSVYGGSKFSIRIPNQVKKEVAVKV